MYRRIIFKILICILPLTFALPCVAAEPSKKETTIAFVTCIAGYKEEMWKALGSHNPDYLLFLGDNVYAENREYTDINKMRRLYDINFNHQLVKKIMKETSVNAIWDDHDFGDNDADSAFPYKNISLQAFKEQWKNPPPPPGLEDSIAFKVESDDFKILMTDDRSYKINSADTIKAVYFGDKQLSWLEKEIISGDKKLVFIASGNTLFSSGGNHEGIHQAPQEAKRLYQAIESSPSEVVILTGDLHFARIVKKKIAAKNFYEILSSPFTAPVRSHKKLRPEPNQIAVYDQDNNFGLIKIDKDLNITAQIINSKNQVVIDTLRSR